MFISDDRINVNFDKLEGYVSGHLVIDDGKLFIETPIAKTKNKWRLVPIQKDVVEVFTYGYWELLSVDECKAEAIDGGYLYAGLRARVKQEGEE